MRYQSLEIRAFEVGGNSDGETYITVLRIDTSDWGGSLFHCERDMDGDWRFDLLYMRQALFALRDWWDDQA